MNTGNVLVGNIGAEGRQMDYTVIGDHVNLASRIEGLTRKYHTHILISEYTLSKIRADIESGLFSGVEIRGLGKEKVRGREHPVAIYEVRRSSGARSFITEPSE